MKTFGFAGTGSAGCPWTRRQLSIFTPNQFNLRPYTVLESVCYGCVARREHEWAAKVAAMTGCQFALI
jgi:hypothetical protein